MKYRLYSFLRVIVRFIMKCLLRAEIIGEENIPKEEGTILAGNHKSNLDCVLLMSTTKRMVRYIAKKELLDGKMSWFYKKMGIIPVDRQKKNKEAINEAVKCLKNKEIIGIFPEGTFNRTEYVTMPFKMGTVKMASEADCVIVPFAIINDYKWFKKSVKIVFDKPYKIKNKNDLKKENIILMNKVIKLLKNGDN